jgi:hypothetical protein
MKKLRLELDDIRVDTFELQDAGGGGGGTVEGQQEELFGATDVTCAGAPGCVNTKNSPNCWTKVTSGCWNSCWNRGCDPEIDP